MLQVKPDKSLRTSKQWYLDNKHTQWGMAMLLNDAAARGMILDSDNSGDGNCMFLAIAQQLRKFGIKIKKNTHGNPERNY